MKSVFALAILLALTFLAGCSSDPIEHVTLPPAQDPAGARANVLDNPLHAAHLSGTTPLPCAQCHDTGAATFQKPASERCIACHPSNEVALHGPQLPCTECHDFAAGAVTDKADCQRCHAQEQAGHMAIKAHGKVDCRNCHVVHGEPKLAVRTCTTCHEDHQQGHGKPELTTIERCSQCHPPHTKSIEAVARCQNCHEEKLVRAVFRGHNKCETCHQNDRQSAPEKPIECASCHKERLTLAASRVSAHANCKNCHAPHDPRGTAIQSCRRCHDDVSPKHPTIKNSGSCIGCHAPHPKSADFVVSACTQCHQNARADNALHAPKKTTCAQCHKPHQFTPVSCQSCHERQVVLTANASGHKKCESCHRTPHAPKTSMAACASCHGSENDSAPSGHRACANCHEAHSGRRLPEAQCSSCHREKLAATHGRIGGGCANCHRAHGPGGRATPPACTTCHARTKLPALHAVANHGNCANCHQGHGMRELNRATCLTCHTDRVDHEPVAKTCVGCHPFGDSR